MSEIKVSDVNIEISDELRTRAVKWCRQALCGIWKTLQENDLKITQLSGGLSSHLYICSLSPHKMKEVTNGDPATVLLRLYGDMANSTPGFIQHNSLVSMVMAERHMGPQIYAFFNNGRIEQFIKAKSLQLEQMRDPHISTLIARRMARFHQMDMPLPKEPKWLFKYINDLVKDSRAYLKTDDKHSKHRNHLINKLLTYDFTEMIAIVRDVVSKVPSPVVFCHNDLQLENMLYRSESDEPDPEKRIVFIDYEFSHYNWRGMDWGNHFTEWCWDYRWDKAPYFRYFHDKYPTQSQMEHFIRAYMSACGETDLSPDQLNDLCHEIRSFTLPACLLWALWSIVMAFTSTIQFGYLEHALQRLEMFYAIKKEYLG